MITTNQLAFDFDAPALSASIDPLADGWAALRRFHAAVVHFDPDEQFAARDALRAASEGVDGDCVYDRQINLLDALRAGDDAEPLFGQAFSRVVDIAGCRVEVVYEGFASLGFLSCHALDWDKPFLSETGFKSVLHTPGYTSLDALGFGILGRAMDHVIARVHADIADKKGNVRLVPIGPQWRDIHFDNYRVAA